jgi:hypothetical protein
LIHFPDVENSKNNSIISAHPPFHSVPRNSVFADIFNGLYGKHLSFNDLVLIYNTIAAPEMAVPGSSDSLELSVCRCSDAAMQRCSDAQRRMEWWFRFLRETARLWSILNTKNLIILIVASGLVKIFSAFSQWEFDDLRSMFLSQTALT